MLQNKYFDFYFENPFKTYNKIKEYFRTIKPKFQIDWFKSNKAKILEINSFDLMWKDKWNSPRHEFNPRINISIFNRLHIYINFTVNGDSMTDMVYWEAALYWLYYRKSLSKAVTLAGGWSDFNEETQKYEPIKFKLLREPYQSKHDKGDLINIMYERSIKN